MKGTHIILDIDITHALVIELLLHVGDGSIVSRDSVDPRVLQPPLLHQLTADLHNKRHKLQDKRREEKVWKREYKLMRQLFLMLRVQMYSIFISSYRMDGISRDLVGLCRRTVIQPHSKCDSRRWLLLKRFPH